VGYSSADEPRHQRKENGDENLDQCQGGPERLLHTNLKCQSHKGSSLERVIIGPTASGSGDAYASQQTPESQHADGTLLVVGFVAALLWSLDRQMSSNPTFQQSTGHTFLSRGTLDDYSAGPREDEKFRQILLLIRSLTIQPVRKCRIRCKINR